MKVISLNGKKTKTNMESNEELQLQIEELKNQVNDLRVLSTKNTFSNTQLVTSEVSQLGGGYQSANFVTGSTGWRFDALGNLEAGSGYFRGDITGATGTFSGTVTVGSLAIGTTPNWLKVDTSGNMWSGAADLATAKTTKFAVENTGALYATSATISGALTTQVGSTINGTYIDSLVVSKLAAGTISSKAITLAVTAGSGDSYIGAGKTDFTNTDSGFILGIDDSDSDLAKFYVGNSTQYLNFDGVDLSSTGLKLLDSKEAGENLTTGNIVCTKIGYTDYAIDHDSYIRGRAVPDYRDTNYGSSDVIYIDTDDAGSGVYGLVKLSDLSLIASAENILKVELRIMVKRLSAGDATIQLITSDWNESTVTWNTQPTYSDTVQSGYGITKTQTNLSANETWVVWDITQLFRHWKAGNVANYGLMIIPGSSADCDFYSSEEGVEAKRPVFRVYDIYNSDGKLYKADCDDYLLCRSIVGVAQETKNAGLACKYQQLGKITNISFGSSYIGAKFYLSTTAGGYLTSNNNATRMISLGDVVDTSEAILGIQKNNIFIEKNVNTMGSSGTPFKIYALNDAKKISVLLNAGGSYYDYVDVERDSLGISSKVITDSNGTSWVTIAWGANFVTVTRGGAGALLMTDYYFYS